MVEDRDTGISTVVLLDRRSLLLFTVVLLPSTWMVCSPVPMGMERSSTQAPPSECTVSVVAIYVKVSVHVRYSL